MEKISSSSEDYLEAIFLVTRQGRAARSTDVADLLDVSMPSVNRAVGNLKEAGLVEHESYGEIKLTAKGKGQASRVLMRHNLIKRFLEETLGVDEKNAERDACRMEHVMSRQTIEKLEQYVSDRQKRAQKNGSGGTESE